ncbi:RibD family protein [Waterburya agarophytonicola K14]|uniref:RibD family protein n=1 Tax=Waterburya agarophytonicola KI4 TaxID=2874699 RepID=A0A964BMW2_9CYAN|nr:RibD family protein [Waterburya agarophytonicola]MCC0176313.1 RibD family protein [Waterburya agarophytonicola KI4]
MNNRSRTIAILAMTADGKIADNQGSAARFGSAQDKLHLERQVSLVDGVIFGAGTLRAYGTTLSVSDPQLQKARKMRSQSVQPVQIVLSASGNLNPQWRFFQQPVPRWLLTLPINAQLWRNKPEFERIIVANTARENDSQIDWLSTLILLKKLGLNKLAILGGGESIASLMAQNSIDELWLTVCPVIFGGNNSPTPVGGKGFLQSQSKKLKLLEFQQVESEVFLHYQVSNN